jgi:HTH-type transcriptional regulator, glycine betaine synthesis regulator
MMKSGPQAAPATLDFDPAEAKDVPARQECERGVIDLFVRLAGLIGVPRSVGELYGFLYISPQPQPMDALSRRLALSKGATSQGLKFLRSVGAVRVVYVPGDRRDHFTAEVELRKLAEGFLREQVLPHVHSGRDRLSRLESTVNDLPEEERDWYAERMHRLTHWQQRADRFLPLLVRLTRL